jgi:hypothetical protein
MQYNVQLDLNANNRNAPVKLVWTTFYGRLLQILAFSLPSNCPFQDATATPLTHVLALIAPTPPTKHRNRLGMKFYSGDKLQNPKIIDLACIQCVIGRVKDRGMWAVIDRGELGKLLESHKDVLADFGE